MSSDIIVNNSTMQFNNAMGGTVLFHGVNAVYKVDPYIPSLNSTFDPQLSLNAQDISDLHDKWGMNLMRLGVMWEAVERTEGTYDDAYLDQIEKLINDLG